MADNVVPATGANLVIETEGNPTLNAITGGTGRRAYPTRMGNYKGRHYVNGRGNVIASSLSGIVAAGPTAIDRDIGSENGRHFATGAVNTDLVMNGNTIIGTISGDEVGAIAAGDGNVIYSHLTEPGLTMIAEAKAATVSGGVGAE